MMLLVLLVCSLAAAAPMARSPLSRRQVATLCDQFGYWSGNGYEINNNNWGKASASSGSQCTYVDGSSSAGVSWHTTWTWADGNGVKSYANSGKQTPTGHTIASINSMPTSVSWQYNTSSIRANVAYDFFTAEDPNHAKSSGDYEMMIWLGNFGNVSPIGSSTGSVTVAGHSWDLHVGMNGAMRVYSFVAPSNMNSFSGDAKEFFKYLERNEDYPSKTQNLIVFQLGTEAFTGGPATFSVGEFSAGIS